MESADRGSSSQPSFRVRKLLLNIIGAWPTKNPSTFFKIRKYFCWFINTIFIILLANAIYENINDFNRLSQIIYVLGALVCVMIKLASLHLHQYLFLTTYQRLKYPPFVTMSSDSFWEIAAKYKKIIKIVSLTYSSCLAGIVLLFGGFPFIDHTALFTYISVESVWLRSLLYGGQFFCMGVGALETAAWDVLTMEVMGIASIHLEGLNAKLVELKDNVVKKLNKDGKRVDLDQFICQEIHSCVVWQQNIIAYIHGINRIFSIGLFVQLFFGNMLVSINTGLNLVKTSPLSIEFIYHLLLFSASTIELSVMCSLGDDIIEKSSRITDSCYSLDWCNYSLKVKKELIIIMERSKKPLIVSAILTKLSLGTLKSIMRTSYTYFSVLFKVYKE